jgi:hypothetical protein
MSRRSMPLRLSSSSASFLSAASRIAMGKLIVTLAIFDLMPVSRVCAYIEHTPVCVEYALS